MAGSFFFGGGRGIRISHPLRVPRMDFFRWVLAEGEGFAMNTLHGCPRGFLHTCYQGRRFKPLGHPSILRKSPSGARNSTRSRMTSMTAAIFRKVAFISSILFLLQQIALSCYIKQLITDCAGNYGCPTRSELRS